MIRISGISAPVLRRLLLAIVAGLASQLADIDSSFAGEADHCQLDKAVVQAVEAASKGDLSAFTAMNRPYSVASFHFNDADGTQLSLADWRGRTVLVNLWATWCAPCRAEMPHLDKLQAALGSEQFEVVAISVDRGDAVKPKAMFADIGIRSMGFFHDSEAMTLTALRRDGLAIGLPATLLVDGRGCAIGRLNGPADWAGADAQTLIKAVLQDEG